MIFWNFVWVLTLKCTCTDDDTFTIEVEPLAKIAYIERGEKTDLSESL